jgi:prophage tail gpP-like protein
VTPDHEIALIAGGVPITGWSTYTIAASMTQPACPFSLTIPFSREVWDLTRIDTPVQVSIDGVVILSGWIDDQSVPEGEEVIAISGRDRSGRLVQDCAPGINFSGLGIKDIVRKLVDPWGIAVTFDNTRNRRVIRGHGGKAKGQKKGAGFTGKVRQFRAGDESLRLNTHVGTQIEPGQTRWQVIQTLAAQVGCLAWMSGDGRELIVGAPDYDQDAQFTFFYPRSSSSRTAEATCIGMGVHNSSGDRYSRVIVVGSGTGTDANYGTSASSRSGEALNNEADPEGVGLDFTAPKRLIVSRAVASQMDARIAAEREMQRRDSAGHRLVVRCAGHGQIFAGSTPTLFAPDTLAVCEDERTGSRGIYLVTDCSYQSARTGEETTMTLVRSGSLLTDA